MQNDVAAIAAGLSEAVIDWKAVAYAFAQDEGGCDYAVCADLNSPWCHCNDRVQAMIRRLPPAAANALPALLDRLQGRDTEGGGG